MGKELVSFYKEKVKTTWKIAFFSVMIIGLLTHLYKFTNYLPDRDSLVNLYHDQNIVGSGRWFLSVACGLGSYFDLPMVNGVLSLFYIALTAVVLTELFHMENPVVIILSGGILAAFPGVTETFLYEYTADGYLLAMLLSAAAVWLTRMQDQIRWKAWVGSGICLCLCCGIYQSYVSFALVLILCHYLYELLENRWDRKTYLLWPLRQVLLLVVSMAAYYLIWKLCLKVQQVEVNDYQGISAMGTDFLGTFLNGFKMMLRIVVQFFVQWNVLKFGFTVYSVLNLLFLAAFAGILITAALRSGLLGRKWQLALFGLSLLLIAPCCCMWAFVSRDILYRPMMLLALAILYIFALMLFERWAPHGWANAAGALMTVIVLNFCLMANIGYYYLDQCYEKTYADGIHMMMDIEEMKETHSFTRIAVIGDGWLENKLQTYDPEKKQQTPASSIHIFSQYMYNDLLFDHDRVTAFLNHYLGVGLEPEDPLRRLQLAQDPLVRQMPCWPETGSMEVVEGTLVLKLYE